MKHTNSLLMSYFLLGVRQTQHSVALCSTVNCSYTMRPQRGSQAQRRANWLSREVSAHGGTAPTLFFCRRPAARPRTIKPAYAQAVDEAEAEPNQTIDVRLISEVTLVLDKRSMINIQEPGRESADQRPPGAAVQRLYILSLEQIQSDRGILGARCLKRSKPNHVSDLPVTALPTPPPHRPPPSGEYTSQLLGLERIQETFVVSRDAGADAGKKNAFHAARKRRYDRQMNGNY